MAGNIWGLSLKGELGQTLSKIEFPDIAAIVSTGAQKVIDNIPHTPVAVQDNSGNISTGYAANSDLEEFQVTEVQIPANFAGLEAVMVPTRLMDQLFEITEVDEQDDYVEVVAVHIFYQQRQNTTLWEPIDGNEYTAAAACRNVLDYAMFPVDFSVASDCTDKLPGSELDFARKNIVDAFLNPETGLCKKFDLSLIRDNDRFYCLKNVGFDRGFVIEDKKNLLGVQRTENIEDVVTRIAPVGYDPDGKIVWLDYNGKKYVDSPHVTDYARPKLGLYDTGLQIGRDGVTADNIQAKLLEEAQKQFSEKHVDLPAVTMTVEFVSLGDTEEYKQYRNLDKVYLFDIIHIKEEERGYLYAAQVIGVEHDILRGRLNSVTIGTPEKWDGVRKVATWQIPEISGDNIRLGSIRAGSFQTNAIHSADIKSGAVEARHFSQSADGHFETIFAEQLYISNTSEDGLLNTRFSVSEGNIEALVTKTGVDYLPAGDTIYGQLQLEAGKVAMVVGTGQGGQNFIKAAEIATSINNAGQGVALIAADHVNISSTSTAHLLSGSIVYDENGNLVLKESSGGGVVVERTEGGTTAQFGVFDNGTLTAGVIATKVNGVSSTNIYADKILMSSASGANSVQVEVNGKITASDITANFVQARISDIAILTANALSVAGGINGSGTLTVANLATFNGSIRLGSGNSFSKCIVSASVNDSTNTLTLTDSSGDTVTFSKATSLSGGWSGTTYTVTASPQGNTISTSVSLDLTGSANVIGASVKNGATTLDSKGAQLTEDVADKKVYVTLTGGSQSTIAQVSTQNTYDAGVTAGEGKFSLATVTLQGSAVSGTAYHTIPTGGTVYYTAGTAVTKYNRGSKETYYRGNGTRLSGQVTRYQGNGVKFTKFYTGVVYYYDGISFWTLGNGYWYQASADAGDTEYGRGTADTNCYVASSSGSNYLRGDTVDVYQATGGASITPIGSTSLRLEQLTYAYGVGSTVSNTYYTKTT